MRTLKEQWKEIVAESINSLLTQAAGMTVSTEEVVVETPPKQELGDIAFPMFPFAKLLKRSPKDIAEEVKSVIEKESKAAELGAPSCTGPYLNIHINRPAYIGELVRQVADEGQAYGLNNTLTGHKIMIEFSCPNTNKPLHLGHLRNDSIGESLGRILDACGAHVQKVNLINDRGVHICKSMLAYEKFGEGKTPESEKVKGDHFVGDYYVQFNGWAKEDETAEKKAREMLKKWEEGDPETTRLWKLMNRWAIDGIKETYERTNIHFDKIYYESETYIRGKEEVLNGLEQGHFYRDDEGTVWVDLEDIGLDKKVLLRGDGTTLYLTQDIGTALARRDDWDFNRMIYVVGSEQKYHFTVLFHILQKMGYSWAEHLYHLAYGMVNLPEGKMKSREGTVVDADDLLDELVGMAKREIIEKEREDEVDDIEKTAEAVALSALNYYLLQVTPSKDMVFDPKESIAFNGNTGPYLQYTGARITAMLKKYEQRREEFSAGSFDPDLLTAEDEWTLIRLIGAFSAYIEESAETLNPAVITGYLYELAKTFSHYYHENPVLHNDDPNLVVSRITLIEALLQVMQNGFYLIGIPFLTSM